MYCEKIFFVKDGKLILALVKNHVSNSVSKNKFKISTPPHLIIFFESMVIKNIFFYKLSIYTC